MPRKQTIPKYGLHKPTGQARVTLNGKQHYLGQHGTEASRQLYNRLIVQYLSGELDEDELSLRDGYPDILLSELMVRYLKFAKTYYVKHGESTGEYENITYALRPLRKLYADTLARDFGPKSLKLVREHMIEFEDLSRKLINARVNTIRRMFKWGVSEELIPASVHQALKSLEGLRRGRTNARETEPVKPVDDRWVERTLRFLPPTVADMVRVQRLAGMRPGSVTLMRPCDIDRSDDVWIYTPASHKTEHHDIDLEVYLGPKAQKIIEPYITNRAPHEYMFSPAEAMAWRHAQRAKQPSKRKTPLYPSEKKRVERAKRERGHSTGKRSVGERYTTVTYYRAVQYGITKGNKAGVEIDHWHPSQLRHTHGTDIRKRYGIEEASVLLGHRNIRTTEIYAERDRTRGIKVARQTG